MPNGLLCRRFNIPQPMKESNRSKKVKENTLVPPMFLGNREQFFSFQNEIESDIKLETQILKESIESKFETKEILYLDQQQKSDSEKEEKELEKEQEKPIPVIQKESELQQKKDLFQSIFGDDEE
eukprot:TRINITY_DN32430_c0_g1_i1.p2 TRINITY_DN32430_c0_g1~~TRINITY_DN32430_c0_g1_i1.p2  ORF type:complete len:125 (-),score=39.48 TRINITY_DN32430_c0_g1_i1:49-423(-)